MVRSAPPEKFSLPVAITQPLIVWSAATFSTMADNSSITPSVMTFIERPGMSQIARAIPSASISKRKLSVVTASFLLEHQYQVARRAILSGRRGLSSYSGLWGAFPGSDDETNRRMRCLPR